LAIFMTFDMKFSFKLPFMGRTVLPHYSRCFARPHLP
jgi:hypothetical protein